MAASNLIVINRDNYDPYGIALSDLNWSLEETMQLMERVIFDMRNGYAFPPQQLEELIMRFRRKLRQFDVEPIK